MEIRQRTTLSDQMAISNSPNLRDLLKLREENERRGTLTLGSILDIIRDEEGSSSSGAYTTIITTSTTNNNNRTSWKFFRNRRVRRSAAWISAGLVDSRSTVEIAPPEATAGDSDQIGSPEAERTDLAAALAAERRQQLQRREVGDVSPARVSLMALLEETDTCPGVICGEGEEEEELGKERGRGDCVCCVCMVRKKGAAFIPCGHTFCRVCSRELWISRGNCPLCNASILEILDIF
ncbi:hypothetical protein MRB53_001877 [Persea americana]|uniref:Uncharacterized protein n=1 Tax=Persea americana TaxID=3435 RepID=A0ACC2MUK3_PERAE|nr:hypothetical protein MRB53_001877 [Persea americana]